MSQRVSAAGVEVQLAPGKGVAQVICAIEDIDLTEQEVSLRYRGPSPMAPFRPCVPNMSFQVEPGGVILVQTPKAKKAVACQVTFNKDADSWRVAAMRA